MIRSIIQYQADSVRDISHQLEQSKGEGFELFLSRLCIAPDAINKAISYLNEHSNNQASHDKQKEIDKVIMALVAINDGQWD